MPIIWKDRDFDHTFLTRILQFKLSEMSKLHKSHGLAINSQEKSKDLEMAADLAKNITNEDYTDEAFGDKKYLLNKREVGFVETDEGVIKLTVAGLSENETKEFKKMLDLETELLERDISLLFNLMKRDLRKWWD